MGKKSTKKNDVIKEWSLTLSFVPQTNYLYHLLSASPARAVKTLKNIGPAVFNGGFSTFLAFVLLVDSTSYGFVLFFRVSFN